VEDVGMVTRERRAERGRQRGMRLGAEIGRALRLARRSAGLSQRAVADLLGVSQAMVSRIERGAASASVTVLATFAEVVGLELSVRLFPASAPVRESAHAGVFERLKRLLPDWFVWLTEVPLPIRGDRRAIDAMISQPRINAGFELESRLGDAQATARRCLLKQRDAGLDAMILVLADTRANRLAVAGADATLRAAFPLSSRTVLRALRAGRAPEGNGIVFV
jgi:putative transcriptional regulator